MDVHRRHRYGIAQQFVRHTGIVYKIYAAGQASGVVHRPSIDNQLGLSEGFAHPPAESKPKTPNKKP